MPNIISQLLLQLILILLNAFFAATEIAMISLNEKRVKARAEDGDKKAAKMLKMIEEPTGFLSTIQVGITLAGFLGSAFAADNFAEDLCQKIVSLSPKFAAYEGLIDTLSVIFITLILSFFTLVLGELVPKRLAMKNKEKLAELVCGIISAISVLLKPIIFLLTASTNGILRLFGVDPNEKEETVSEEDIVLMLDAGADEGTLRQDDIEYIKNVFKLDRLTAADIMTQRKAITFISLDATTQEIMDTIDTEGYSRMPVYGENMDEIVGILYARDFLLKHNNPGFKIQDSIFQPTFVPETMKLDTLFKDMQTQHNHIVVVVNEYGIPSGIVTMEDIIEEIVGEIWDERDEAIDTVIKVSENVYKVLCTASLDEFFSFFELDLPEESEATTVNGWLIENCGNIPQKGYNFKYETLNITVVEADDLMASEIMVTVEEPEPDESKEQSQE